MSPDSSTRHSSSHLIPIVRKVVLHRRYPFHLRYLFFISTSVGYLIPLMTYLTLYCSYGGVIACIGQTTARTNNHLLMVVVWFGLKIGILFSLSFLQVLLSQWKALGFIIVAIAFLGYLLIANALWSSFTGSLKVR